jgi:hypothetical protein
LARSHVEGAEAVGHEVRSFRLGDLEFDPILMALQLTAIDWKIRAIRGSSLAIT